MRPNSPPGRRGSPDAAPFEPDGYWRVLASFSWNIATLDGQDAIVALLAAQLTAIKPQGFTIASGEMASDGGGFEQAFSAWRNRYKSLCLHDPVRYDHLPYMPFPANWPIFAPKDKLGDWLDMYTRVMERQAVTQCPKQLVLATGMSAKANWPTFAGQQSFKGEQLHSCTHPGPDAYAYAYAGKKVVVKGEQRNMWKPTAKEGLWFHGGNLHQSRHNSQFLALQLQARMLGLDTPVYCMGKVHHLK